MACRRAKRTSRHWRARDARQGTRDQQKCPGSWTARGRGAGLVVPTVVVVGKTAPSRLFVPGRGHPEICCCTADEGGSVVVRETYEVLRILCIFEERWWNPLHLPPLVGLIGPLRPRGLPLCSPY